MKKEPGLFEHRVVALLLSAVLFGNNFLLFYFIWLFAFPEVMGIMRLVFCWVGAYVLTWAMTCLAKGVARLILTMIMIGVQYFVFHYRP